MRPSIDFETYSEAGYILDVEARKVRGITDKKRGLSAVGIANYAAHPSTEIICLAYNLQNGCGPQLWIPGMPNPTELLIHISSHGDIEAWNVTFEWYIWNLVATNHFDWPPLQLSQCYCAMAKARRFSLPGALDNVAKVLGVAEKDKRGKQLIQRLSVPVNPTKNRPGFRRTLQTDLDDYLALYQYCKQDTVAEDAVSALTPELTTSERETWFVDQVINARGVAVDIETLDASLDILEQVTQYYTQRLSDLTNGTVNSVNENQKFKDWINAQGVSVESIAADNVIELLSFDTLPPGVREALEIRQELGSANVKKLMTLKLQVSSDSRLRDAYTYCGADRTGRWSSGGVQLQNLTSVNLEIYYCHTCRRLSGISEKQCPRCESTSVIKAGYWNDDAIEQAIADIRQRDFILIERVWGKATEILCGIIRGLFIAKPGHRFICCDFSSIEAVVAACISGCQWRIDAFANGEDIYLKSASAVTYTPFDEYLEYAKQNDKDHPDRKKLGKPMELGLGFGGWINALRTFGWEGSDEEAKEIVLNWRAASPEIVEMWGGQYVWCGPGKWDYRPELFGLEGMAIKAILYPGVDFSYRCITYIVRNDVLYCRLPSGRYLYYHQPRLITTQDRLNRGPAFKITYWGFNSDTTKGSRGWAQLELYGGKQFENVVQAIANDIQSLAIKRLESREYPVVMHTHDEQNAEVLEGFGSIEEMCAIICEREPWFADWPIRANGWSGQRYKKD